MADDPFDSPGWYQALSLVERRGLGPFPPADHPRNPRAGARGAEWRSQNPFPAGDWFLRRLAADGLTPESFEAILAVPPEATRGCVPDPPEWLRALAEAYDGAGPPGALPAPAPEAFLDFMHPLIERARRRLRTRVSAAPGSSPLPFDPDSVDRLLLGRLHGRLLAMVDRTLVLELNVARLRDELEGDDAAARFLSFIERLRRPEAALALFEEYPVLARDVSTALDRWVETAAELLDRLRADLPALRVAFFEGLDPGPLAGIETGAGDSHRGGRSVAVLRFASGRMLVYKPRPLAGDRRFQELLEWVNRRGAPLPFRTLTVLDRGEYGWVEFVEAGPCAAAAGVERYYRRQGGLLALLHALDATDFHFENLIAAGEHPVAIDLESLFHPRLSRPETSRPDHRLGGALLGRSVLRVGLLPFRVGETDDYEGVDLSGMGSAEGQRTPDRVLQWEGAGTDAMRAVRRRMEMPPGKNRPSLDGREESAADHREAVTAGFEEIYRLLVRERSALLAPGGPLAAFAADRVRAVLRATRAYGLLQAESAHPDYLRDALDRDRFFDRLWVGVEEQPELARVAAAEHRDLREGDIPYFHTRPNTADVWTSRGERIPDFFQEPAMDAVRRKIEEMDEADLERQRDLIRLSLGVVLLNRDTPDPPPYAPVDVPPDPDVRELRRRALAEAVRLGDWFAGRAVADERDAIWLGLDFRAQRWSLGPMAEDLYGGLGGIALFLGHLGAVTAEPRFSTLAGQAAHALIAQTGAVADRLVSIGGFQGWGGVVYVLARLGALRSDRALFAAAEAVIPRIDALLEADRDLDVIGGAAGAILGLLALHRASGSPAARQSAVRCGAFLLDRAAPAGAGLGWTTRIGGDLPQIGFSHGASGIGAALAELGAATGDPRFAEGAAGAFAFERGSFWAELRRWLDEGAGPLPAGREAPLERAVAMAWCYGAPGVGLARLRALDHREVPAWRDELDDALALTLDRGFGRNHCLCHGDLGNLDFLLQALERNPSADLARRVNGIAAGVVGSIERDGWLPGTRGGVEAPALMNGYAGIGYGLLRLAEPGRVPSVLVLESPPGS